jgi:transcription termination factor NusB
LERAGRARWTLHVADGGRHAKARNPLEDSEPDRHQAQLIALQFLFSWAIEEVSLMTLQLTNEEREYLMTLLEATHREKLHELHHTDRAEYKGIIRSEIAMIETLRVKLAAT